MKRFLRYLFGREPSEHRAYSHYQPTVWRTHLSHEVKPSDEPFKRFSLMCDKLRNVSQDIKVKSFSFEDTTYNVSLAAQTCTCPNFSKRSAYLKGCFPRWCKHLVNSLNEHGAFAISNEWHKAIANEGYGGPLDAFLVKTARSQVFLTTIGENPSWINVYGRRAKPGEEASQASGTIKQFGWSISEQRWSHGIAPPGARQLRVILLQIEGLNYDESIYLDTSSRAKTT